MKNRDWSIDSTYDLRTEREAEQAYRRALIKTNADTLAIRECERRIRAIEAELRRREATAI